MPTEIENAKHELQAFYMFPGIFFFLLFLFYIKKCIIYNRVSLNSRNYIELGCKQNIFIVRRIIIVEIMLCSLVSFVQNVLNVLSFQHFGQKSVKWCKWCHFRIIVFFCWSLKRAIVQVKDVKDSMSVGNDITLKIVAGRVLGSRDLATSRISKS